MFGENIVLNRKEEILPNREPQLHEKIGLYYNTPQLYTALLNGFTSLVEGLRMGFYDLLRQTMWADRYHGDNWPVTYQAMPIFGSSVYGAFWGTHHPPVDVIDNGDFYIVRVELPGFDKEEVSLLAGTNTLKIRAERKAVADGLNYVHREIGPAVFQRTVTFPEEIVASKIEAAMKNGILEVKVLKSGTKIEENLVKVNIR